MKKTLIFLIIVMMFSFSACGWKIEIVNPNDRVIESESDIKIRQEPESEETDKNEYYEEVLEVPENPVKDEEDSSVSKDFEFSEQTKEVTAKTVAYIEKEITFILPDSTVFEGEGDNRMAVFSDGSSLLIGWMFAHKLEETPRYDDTLYYYRNPEESLGYISHEKAVCGNYECLRIICGNGGGDKNSPEVPVEEKFYKYQYFFEISDSEVLSLDFYAKGPKNTEAMKLQEKIIANLSAEAPEIEYTAESETLSVKINPRERSSEAGEEKICKDEFLNISMSVPEGWEFVLTEEENNVYGISFNTDWRKDYTAYIRIYKETGGVYDDFLESYSLWVGINEHTYHEASGNFSKGSYIRFDYPAGEKYDTEEGAVPVYARFYQLLFGEYVAVIDVYIRTDSAENTLYDEKICDEFISSIKIG